MATDALLHQSEAKAGIPATVAAGTPETWFILKGPDELVTGQLCGARLLNGGALTGHATNYTTIDIYNLTDSVVMASRAVDTATTDNVVDTVPWELDLSTVAGATKFSANDVIIARKTDSGTGMAITIPATIQIDYILNATYD